MKREARRIIAAAFAAFYGMWGAAAAQAYSFNMIVPDVRQPPTISGGSACPVRAHQLISAGSISFRWSTALNTNPVTILTLDQTVSGQLNEIEQTINQTLAIWTGVSGTTLVPATLMPLTRTATQNACGADGLNSICFDQADMAFTPGVLAFTRVIMQIRLARKPSAAQSPRRWDRFWMPTFISIPAIREPRLRHRRRWARLPRPTIWNRCWRTKWGTRWDSAIRRCGAQ